MAKRNKKITKLRRYRDSLLTQITDLEGHLRRQAEAIRLARMSLQQEDTLRTYALLTPEDRDEYLTDFDEKNELAKELALVYRFLIVERTFTRELDIAIAHNDWLRAKALASQHFDDIKNHEIILSEWARESGFTKILRENSHEELVT